LPLLATHLHPVASAPASIRPIAALADDPLEREPARLAKRLLARAFGVRAESQRSGCAAKELLERALARFERYAAKVEAVEVHQVEHAVRDVLVAAAIHRILQLLKARLARRPKHDGLAVEERGFRAKPLRRRRDRGEASGPVVAAAREQSHVAVVDPCK